MPKSNLIDHLRSVGNKSGAIPAAGVNLLTLKSAIESLPMEVTATAMSTIVDVENLVTGIVDLTQVLGSLTAIGDFRNILGKIAADVAITGITDITKLDPDALAAAVRRSIPIDELKAAVGNVTAITASMAGSVQRLTS